MALPRAAACLWRARVGPALRGHALLRMHRSSLVVSPDSNPFAGQTQASMVVDQLWRQRQAQHQDGPAGKSTPPDSELSILYSFETDRLLAASYANPWGSFRVGRLLEDLDALAGNVAAAHCGPETADGSEPLMLVTASVDRIRIARRFALDQNVVLTGRVTWVGSSSLEISLHAYLGGAEEGGEGQPQPAPWLDARFTFVARGAESQRAARVPRLRLETAHDRAVFAAADERVRQRKELARLGREGVLDWPGEESMQRARAVLEEARVLRDMPSLAPANSMLLGATRLSNALICQPQMQNTRGRIFGGLLMRRGMELAFTTAYLFGGAQPRFREIDRIDFLSPVDIGDLVKFDSCVLYTSQCPASDSALVHVEVEATVKQPELRTSVRCNVLNFTFSLPPGVAVRRVLPASVEESQRVVLRQMADEQQDREEA